MLSGATRLGSYVIVVAPTSPPLLVADSTTFFTVLFKGYERSPSVGRSISGGHSRPVEINGQEANTKRTH